MTPEAKALFELLKDKFEGQEILVINTDDLEKLATLVKPK